MPTGSGSCSEIHPAFQSISATNSSYETGGYGWHKQLGLFLSISTVRVLNWSMAL